jgi:cytidine deaminase
VRKGRKELIEDFVSGFPEKVRDLLWAIPDQGGALTEDQARELTTRLDWSMERLMVKLLGLARIHAVVPVSDFRVGAVAWAESGSGSGNGLFLGANYEFRSQPLNQSIHAEQAAATNAWQAGAKAIQSLAVTDAPCGHCRQFLYEFGAKAKEMVIITPGNGPDSLDRKPLGELLPQAFGPLDLGLEGVSDPDREGREQLCLARASTDPLVLEALAAARRSHAPYSGNRNGCALLLDSGRIVSGSGFESAAFNPSLSPLHSAVLDLNMSGIDNGSTVRKAVLVERPTTITQKGGFEGLLKTWAPKAEMEYHQAET